MKLVFVWNGLTVFRTSNSIQISCAGQGYSRGHIVEPNRCLRFSVLRYKIVLSFLSQYRIVRVCVFFLCPIYGPTHFDCVLIHVPTKKNRSSGPEK